MSARAELELRQLLAERERRIDQLKQGRVALSPRPTLPRPEQWSEAEEAITEETGEQRAAWRQQVVDLRIEVAKKEAAVAGLQGALADATANGRRQDADLQEIYHQVRGGFRCAG